ncbi:hypothetical protein [Phenylobacterium sp.]|uniref:hypothetical protein n=1 Tax=Phenylobacterium sp. TaxID=1871053 RepID=UPI0025F16331|nr:hypothetical protein [Phenylobacterium sp.]
MIRFGPLFAGLAVLATAPARAQDAAGARAFVVGLYAAYHGHGPDYLGRQAPQVFAPRLLTLIRRDAAETPQGDVGALDGDPICDCQDAGGLRGVAVEVTGGAGGRASAVAHFRISAEARTVRLDLVAVQGQWRISDVHTADTPSLVSLLTRSLRAGHPKD